MDHQDYTRWLNNRAGCGCLGGCPDCEQEAGDGEE